MLSIIKVESILSVLQPVILSHCGLCINSSLSPHLFPHHLYSLHTVRLRPLTTLSNHSTSGDATPIRSHTSPPTAPLDIIQYHNLQPVSTCSSRRAFPPTHTSSLKPTPRILSRIPSPINSCHLKSTSYSYLIY